MSSISVSDRVALIVARIEILKLMADDYTWKCHTPAPVKAQIEASLLEINTLLESTK